MIEAPAVPTKKQPKPGAAPVAPEPPTAPETKRGPGRPPLAGEAMEVVSFRLPKDIIAALDLWVQQENAKPDPKRANRNTVVTYALRDELTRRGLLASGDA